MMIKKNLPSKLQFILLCTFSICLSCCKEAGTFEKMDGAVFDAKHRQSYEKSNCAFRRKITLSEFDIKNDRSSMRATSFLCDAFISPKAIDEMNTFLSGIDKYEASQDRRIAIRKYIKIPFRVFSEDGNETIFDENNLVENWGEVFDAHFSDVTHSLKLNSWDTSRRDEGVFVSNGEVWMVSDGKGGGKLSVINRNKNAVE